MSFKPLSLKTVRPIHNRRFWKMLVPGIKEFRAQQYGEALPLLLVSAQEGYAEAQCAVGNMYQLGLGDVEVDEMRAIHWYYRAANQGYSSATSNLAGMVWPVSSEAAAALNQLAKRQKGEEFGESEEVLAG